MPEARYGHMTGPDAMFIGQRFCGPEGAANGGYLGGLLAARLGGVVEVTFRRPVPLERPVLLESREGGVLVVLDGDVVLAEALRARVDVAVPPAVSLAEAESATRRFPRFVDHPIPRCFVCGPARERGDGLRIFPGPVAGRDVVAAPWTPDASLADRDGVVRPEFLWAALDCAGAFAVNEPPRGLALLGRLAARVQTRVAAGTPCVVVGWSLGSEARKLHAGTAVFSADGNLCAVARATWILVR
jgi:hypothetical protein